MSGIIFLCGIFVISTADVKAAGTEQKKLMDLIYNEIHQWESLLIIILEESI